MPQIGITTGDPGGIGPEISLRASSDPSARNHCRPILFGDEEILRAQAADLSLPFDIERYERQRERSSGQHNLGTAPGDALRSHTLNFPGPQFVLRI